MRNQKPNEYGQTPLYEVGDTVKVWPIFKNPVGTVERVVDENAFPIKYVVRYRYHDGDVYVEEFAADDLTLVERIDKHYCNCKTTSDRHSAWCNRYNEPKRW